MVECCPKEQRQDVAASLLVRLPIFIMAVVMLVIGNRNECPGAENLPLLLICGGSILLIGGFLRQLVQSCCSCCDSMFDSCETGFKVAKCGAMVLFDLCYVTVTTGWCVAAAIYLSKAVDDKVPFGEEVQGVCEKEVYNMTFAAIIIGFIASMLACLFLVVGRLCCNILFCKACQEKPDAQAA